MTADVKILLLKLSFIQISKLQPFYNSIHVHVYHNLYSVISIKVCHMYMYVHMMYATSGSGNGMYTRSILPINI